MVSPTETVPVPRQVAENVDTGATAGRDGRLLPKEARSLAGHM